MKITIESTTRLVTVDGVECRVWEGESERGVKLHALVSRIAVMDGRDFSQFEAELKEQRAPTASAYECFPLRMTL